MSFVNIFSVSTYNLQVSAFYRKFHTIAKKKKYYTSESSSILFSLHFLSFTFNNFLFSAHATASKRSETFGAPTISFCIPSYTQTAFNIQMRLRSFFFSPAFTAHYQQQQKLVCVSPYILMAVQNSKQILCGELNFALSSH